MFKTTLWILILVFGLLSLTFLGVAAGFGIEEAIFSESALTTPGVISDIQYHPNRDSTEMLVMIAYEVEGVPYTARSSYSSSSMYPGQEVTVKYDPQNPQRMRIDHFPVLPLVFGILGGSFLVVVVILLIVMRRQKVTKEHLLTYGRQVTGKIAEVVRNPNLQMGGRNPYAVVVQWDNPDDGKTYLFRSENLWFNPESIIAQRGITALPVFVDAYDPKKYAVDTASLKENVVAL